MADLLQTALAWLDDKQTAYVAQAVTYHRGSSSVAVTATPGRAEFEITDLATGLSHSLEMRDWLILAADLIIDDAVIEPQPGDQVRQVIGDNTEVFEVQEVAGQQCYKYTSPYKHRLRIHTKQIDTI